ncbi:MAG: GHKL domain-containing protein, partial [Bacilli bacterium]|nr:GHKL domain-containing protein [Bacilli bacterium]
SFLVSVMDIKKKKSLYFISLFISSTFIITLSNYISIYDLFLTSIIIFVNVLISYIFVENDIREIFLYVCTETLVSALSNVFAVIIFENRMALIISSKSFYIIMALFIIYLLRKRKIVYNTKIYMFLSLIMIMLQFIISNFIQLYLFFLNDYQELKLTLIFLILIILLVLFMLIYISDLYQTKQEYEKLKYIKESDEIIKNLYNEVKITKHDIKHVYEMLGYYIKNHEYTKLSKFIDDKQENINKVPVLIQTDNEIVNMILNNKIMKAYSHNLNVEFEVSLKKEIFINDCDINDLLSNALDNAIDYNIENGNIQIKIIQEEAYIYISIKNSTENKEMLTKKNITDHGFGIKSIKRICNKYNGVMETSLKNTEFTLQITLLA